MKYLIYHHGDNDGYLAGAIASQFLSQNEYAEITFKVGNYDTEKDRENEVHLEKADLVYVLDYSLPISMMDRFFNKIVWIDHHKTAMDNMERIEEQRGPFAGIREIGKSGCLLTWEYFNEEPAPLVVKLVDDRDVWKWELGEATASFHEVSRMFMPYYDEWQTLMQDDEKTREKVGFGYPLLKYIRGVIDVYNESFCWMGYFEGHPVVFMNGSGVISGELHKRLRETNPEATFAVTFMFRPDKTTVGLYRADGVTHVSLGKIASKYGGGGHDGAAGFYTSHKEWIEVLRVCDRAPGYVKQATEKSLHPRAMQGD